MRKTLAVLFAVIMIFTANYEFYASARLPNCSTAPLSRRMEVRIKRDWLRFNDRFDLTRNVLINRYRGNYNGSVALMFGVGVAPAIAWSETVAGYTFWYGNGFERTWIWNDGDFYKLCEAYEKGLLTEQDVGAIWAFGTDRQP